MTERPIIFDAESVNAILAGRKTQTRRVMSAANSTVGSGIEWERLCFDRPTYPNGTGLRVSARPHPADDQSDPDLWTMHTAWPRWEPGDRLWVRETFCQRKHLVPMDKGGLLREMLHPRDTVVMKEVTTATVTFYRADCVFSGSRSPRGGREEDWRNAMFMPRLLSRITLEIVRTWAERLQDISEADCEAEGIGPDLAEFATRWDALNAKHGHPWDTNPWVWVIEFKKLEGGE